MRYATEEKSGRGDRRNRLRRQEIRRDSRITVGKQRKQET